MVKKPFNETGFVEGVHLPNLDLVEKTPKGLVSVGDGCFLDKEGVLYTLEFTPLTGIRSLKKQTIKE